MSGYEVRVRVAGFLVPRPLTAALLESTAEIVAEVFTRGMWVERLLTPALKARALAGDPDIRIETADGAPAPLATAMAEVGYEGEGGAEVPDWVPENAKIFIDFVNDRAWTEADGEVAIDTLVGNDPAADSANYDGPTSYNPAGLDANGYHAPGNACLAFIGAAKSALLSGATFTISWYLVGTGSSTGPAFVGSSGVAYIDFVMKLTSDLRGRAFAAAGESPSIETDAVLNQGEGAANKLAATLVAGRADMAVNASDAVTMALTEAEYPQSGDDAINAALLVQSSNIFTQAITIYDPLPSTEGLSELSEIA